MKLSDKTYNVLKWIVIIFLPAFTTFYGIIAQTCDIPYTEQILTILVAFDTFLGSLIGISTKKYNEED